MIEVTILMPAHKVEPESDAEAFICRRACEIFEGCTVAPQVGAHIARGVWVDSGGRVWDEPMRPLIVAVDGFTGLALAVALAREIGRHLGELAVYVSALGQSEIVTCERSGR